MGGVIGWTEGGLQCAHDLTTHPFRTAAYHAAFGEAVVDALDLATSFEAWDRLRSEQGLGSARAQAAVEQTVLALVKEIRS